MLPSLPITSTTSLEVSKKSSEAIESIQEIEKFLQDTSLNKERSDNTPPRQGDKEDCFVTAPLSSPCAEKDKIPAILSKSSVEVTPSSSEKSKITKEKHDEATLCSNNRPKSKKLPTADTTEILAPFAKLQSPIGVSQSKKSEEKLEKVAPPSENQQVGTKYTTIPPPCAEIQTTKSPEPVAKVLGKNDTITPLIEDDDDDIDNSYEPLENDDRMDDEPPESPPRTPRSEGSSRLMDLGSPLPQLMSPLPMTPRRVLDSSPAPPPPMVPMQAQEEAIPSTPVREDDDEFLKPSSTFGTPRRIPTTPMHIPYSPMPPLLSPLPATPYRYRDSERSVNIDYDLELTESEMSDVESTPRHRSQHVSELDMPKLAGDSSSNSRPPKHAYSKDLSKLSLKKSSSSERSPDSKIPPVMLRRQSGNEWNVSSSDEEPGKKLDKVVLNLKKSVGGYTITEKMGLDESISSNSSVDPSSADQHFLPPKEERRGRKSKPRQKILANTETATVTGNKLVQSKAAASETEIVAANLTEKTTPEKRQQGSQENLRLLEVNTSREPKRKSSSSPPAPSANVEKNNSVVGSWVRVTLIGARANLSP